MSSSKEIWTPPAKKPPLPQRQLGPLELSDPEDRRDAEQALTALWYAMDLGRWRINPTLNKAHMYAYENLALMILGKDYPRGEEQT